MLLFAGEKFKQNRTYAKRQIIIDVLASEVSISLKDMIL